MMKIQPVSSHQLMVQKSLVCGNTASGQKLIIKFYMAQTILIK